MKVFGYFLFLAVSLAAWSADDTDKVRVPTADDGDQFVLFSLSTKRPLPVSDDKVEIQGASVAFIPAPDETTKIREQWTYNAHFKGHAKPISILIEDVKKAPVKVAYQANKLTLHDGFWAGVDASKPVSKQLITFLKSGRPLFRVLRITIKYKDGSTSRLYQVTMHDSETLQQALTAAASKIPH